MTHTPPKDGAMTASLRHARHPSSRPLTHLRFASGVPRATGCIQALAPHIGNQICGKTQRCGQKGFLPGNTSGKPRHVFRCLKTECRRFCIPRLPSQIEGGVRTLPRKHSLDTSQGVTGALVFKQIPYRTIHHQEFLVSRPPRCLEIWCPVEKAQLFCP